MSVATVKGWCPGALRPMLSGDGYVVRLRLSGNTAPLALAAEIADWSETYGNGALDLSARGNLQIRGVSEANLAGLTARLAEAGLVDGSPEAEAVRNVLVAPLAGCDPTEAFDVRPYAKALERELAGNRELWALPGKFGFAFGEALPGDVVFTAMAPEAFAVDLAGMKLGPLPASEAVRVAVKIAQAFLALRRAPDPPRRMRDAIAAHGPGLFVAATGLQPLQPTPLPEARAQRASKDVPDAPDVRASEPAAGGEPPWRLAALAPQDEGGVVGAYPLGDLAFAGFALPFGRIAAAELRTLARLAGQAGASELRLSPWRAILVPGLTLAAAQALAKAPHGLIVDPADPRLSVAACPGAPACSSALGETREAAARLAPLLSGGHVSGCPKGCAHPAPAAVTVVAAAGGYDLVLRGRADAAPVARGLTLDAVAEYLQERAA